MRKNYQAQIIYVLYVVSSFPLKNSNLHSGLVYAKDDEDLRAKLLSCRDTWNKIESLYIPQEP